jgi:hypothetical protein
MRASFPRVVSTVIVAALLTLCRCSLFVDLDGLDRARPAVGENDAVHRDGPNDPQAQNGNDDGGGDDMGSVAAESYIPPEVEAATLDAPLPDASGEEGGGLGPTANDSATSDASPDAEPCDAAVDVRLETGVADAAVDAGTAADGAPLDGPATDSVPPSTSYASCLAILNAAPTSASGTYVINPGGTSLTVHCDMAFAGGGWTLVQSTTGGTCTPATETARTVALGSCAYMPNAALTALATGSTTVHVRTASGSAPPVAYITSATAVPIQNLRMGLVTNTNEPVGDGVTEEGAWTVVGDPGNATKQGRTPQSILAFTCAVTGEMWPSVYHACGNGADGFALEVADNVSIWNWGVMPHVNVPIEVYIR